MIGNPKIIMGLIDGAGRTPPNPFPKGNKLAAAENMTPEAHNKRMAGLYKAWALKDRKNAGEKVVTYRMKRKKRIRKRLRLKQTLAKEMREIQEFARKNAFAAMEKAAEIVANSDNETTVLAGIQILLERAYGKASQTNINAHVSGDGKANEISAKELDERIAKALRRVEELSRGKKQAPARKDRLVDLRKLDRDPDSTPLN